MTRQALLREHLHQLNLVDELLVRRRIDNSSKRHLPRHLPAVGDAPPRPHSLHVRIVMLERETQSRRCLCEREPYCLVSLGRQCANAYLRTARSQQIATTKSQNSSRMQDTALWSCPPLGVSSCGTCLAMRLLTGTILEEKDCTVPAFQVIHLVFYLPIISGPIGGLSPDSLEVFVSYVWSLCKYLGAEAVCDEVPQVSMMLPEQHDGPRGLHIEHRRRMLDAVRHGAHELFVAYRAVGTDLRLSPVSAFHCSSKHAHHIPGPAVPNSPLH